MAASEPFTVVDGDEHGGPKLFDDYIDMISAKATDLDAQIVAALRVQHPDLILTVVPSSNVDLLQFAAFGFATAEIDLRDDSILRWRGFLPPSHRGGPGGLGDATSFAKYHHKWSNEDFVLFVVQIGYQTLQYVLKEPKEGETTLGHSSVTDALIAAIGTWLLEGHKDTIYVYDGYWTRSKAMWEEVQKASRDKVILAPEMKKELQEISNKFFDSHGIYEDFGVPWRRGLIYHGPPGNGKTISIKALMRTLLDRKPYIPSLYVKSARFNYEIRDVFRMARAISPCLLILENIDTIVSPGNCSYFFNEVDGLENNDGILMLASTNHLERLDPGLSKRPSRFDRKYLFPLPSKHERALYCGYWREKLKNKPNIEFPKKLCVAIARITHDFSFAYIQEAFVATLLVLAWSRTSGDPAFQVDESPDDGLDKYELWVVMKEQVAILRREMDNTASADGALSSDKPVSSVSRVEEEIVPHRRAANLQRLPTGGEAKSPTHCFGHEEGRDVIIACRSRMNNAFPSLSETRMTEQDGQHWGQWRK